MAVIVYPQTIALEEVKQFIEDSVKEYVPSEFMQPIPLFDKSEDYIMDYIEDNPAFTKPTL
jgi:hypothetical protein